MSVQPFRETLYRALWAPAIKPVLERIPVVRRIYAGWMRPHPFDAAHGVDTSGYMAPDQCAGESGLGDKIAPYGGSQPSIVRAALASLPDHERYALVDIGCGKGRPLIVASEFPFRRIVGVELAPALVEVGRKNASAIASRYPGRTPIEVQAGDATTFAIPDKQIVFFMYHAFDRSLVQALVAAIERQLSQDLEHAFFVYYNPVHGSVLDESRKFARWSAQTHPYAPDELGFGPDLADTVVIWQSRPERPAAREGALRAIRVSPQEWSSLG